jgi:hypothetical protein
VTETQPQHTPSQAAAAGDEPGSWAMMLGVLCLIVALLAYGFGAWQRSRANSYDPEVVRCGEDVMSPGDTCLNFGGGGGGDYAQMRERQEATREAAQNFSRTGMRVVRPALVSGVVLLALGVVELRIRKRTLARRRSGAHP